MSGRRIDDHSFWAGSKSKESPMPMNSKMKQMTSAEGAGSLGTYEDTAEQIKDQQELNIRKAKAQAHKTHYRN